MKNKDREHKVNLEIISGLSSEVEEKTDELRDD